MSDVVFEVSPGTARQLLNRATAPFRGYGMERLPGLRAVYSAVYGVVSPVGERTIRIQGIDMRVDFRDRSIVPSLWLTRRYEATYSRALDGLVGPGAVVVDAGAHVGYYALRYADRGADVFAFEPCSENRRLLANSVQSNRLGSVLLHPAALSDRPGAGELWWDATNTGAAALNRDCVAEPVSSERVEVTTLDVECVDRAPDLIKIDVQGSEAAVLRGASDTVARCRPVVAFEYNIAQLVANGETPQAMLASLQVMDYELYLVDEHRGVVHRTSTEALHSWCLEEKQDGTGFANVIGRPREADSWAV
jgi:FkbM family methyltransferase